MSLNILHTYICSDKDIDTELDLYILFSFQERALALALVEFVVGVSALGGITRLKIIKSPQSKAASPLPHPYLPPSTI